MSAAPEQTDRRPLSVCVLAKMIYPSRVRDQQQDMTTYARLRPWARRIYLVVSSPQPRTRVTHHGNVVGLHIAYHRHPLVGVPRFWLRGFAVASSLMRRRRIDLLMAAEPLVAGPLALLLRRLYRIPVLVHLQGDLFHLPRRLFGASRIAVTRWVTVQVTRRADRVRCVSRALLESCVRAGIPRERLAFLPVRCDFKRFDPQRWRRERETVRRAWGLSAHHVVVLSLGALTVHKGYDVLIEAFARVRARFPTARALLVGAGPLKDSLEAQARRAGVGDVVRLVGPVPYDDVPKVLAAADVYVQPSYDEGIPRATLEAMAMGLPVVASCVGGIPELVQDGVTGILVPPGDPEALAAALEPFLADPGKGRDYGLRARAAAFADFDIDVGIVRYGQLLYETASLSRRTLQ